MTPQAQRIAIAEACGWTIDPLRPPRPQTWHGGENWRLPNYLSDLNAMHEAEKGLTDEQHALFRKLLFTGFYNRGEGTTNDAAERVRVSATAPQRAEAFLRTLGLWKSS